MSRRNNTSAVVWTISALSVFVACSAVADTEPAHFHHVHLNVTDPEATMEFYTRVFGATRIRYANSVDALYTERSFILFNVVDEAPPSALTTGLWHIGWGGIDMPNKYEWLKAQGVKIHTPLYALGSGFVTYVQGPDDELIEVNTMGHNRFGHVHLFAEDVNETVQWYLENLGLSARRPHVPKPDLSLVRAWSNSFRCDNVSIIVYGRPDYEPRPPWWRWEPLTEFESTEGRAIDHIAFSYPDLKPVIKRMREAGVTIVDPISFRYDMNHTSFMVEGPDKVLIEIVESPAIPEGLWDKE